MRTFIDAIFLLMPVLLLAQAKFTYRYNGPGNGADEAYSLAYGGASLVYVGGKSYGDGSDYDFVVVSLDNGSQRWLYRYNGPGNGADEAQSVVFGADGNVYAAGTSCGDDSCDIVVISLTVAGTWRWTYKYDGPDSSVDCALALTYGLDGNIYVAGKSHGVGLNDDLIVISLNSSGNERWAYRYNSPYNGSDAACHIVSGPDSNIYVCGHTGAYGDSSTYFTVLSLSSNGTLRWMHRLGESTAARPGHDEAYDLVVDRSRNVCAVGRSWDFCTGDDFTVVSLSPAGQQRWTFKYKGFKKRSDAAKSIACGVDSNLCVAGYSGCFGSGFDFSDQTVVSLTPAGFLRWVYLYDGPGSGSDVASDIVTIPAFGYLTAIAGFAWGKGTYADFTIKVLTANGYLIKDYTYNGPANGWDRANAIVSDGGIRLIAAGTSQGVNTDDDFTVIEISTLGIQEELNGISHTRCSVTPIFRNAIRMELPGCSNHALKIAVHNVLGEIIVKEEMPSTPRFHILRGERISSMPQGIYFLSLSSGGASQTFKIIKIE